jgi:Tfp pilus assembly protein PilX
MPYEGFEELDEGVHRNLRGRGVEPWGRRVLLTVLTVLAVLALLNVFGQRDANSSARSSSGAVTVSAPRVLRAGLMYQARFSLRAGPHDLNHPTLLLDSGWFDGMTFNGAVPDPMQEMDVGGRVALQLDKLSAGQHSTVWLSFQVNPTTVGKRRADVELDDGQTVIARIHRTLTVLP